MECRTRGFAVGGSHFGDKRHLTAGTELPALSAAPSMALQMASGVAHISYIGVYYHVTTPPQPLRCLGS